ncbi:hypothetical protein NH340_JMT01503 [Sarcoptes scabiei]|nr:hypothetical protein NH340_JMT01503 [Sarcoptes scabiei]
MKIFPFSIWLTREDGQDGYDLRIISKSRSDLFVHIKHNNIREDSHSIQKRKRLEPISLNSIEKANQGFICQSEGYFADVAFGCQFYHVCENANNPFDKPQQLNRNQNQIIETDDSERRKNDLISSVLNNYNPIDDNDHHPLEVMGDIFHVERKSLNRIENQQQPHQQDQTVRAPYELSEELATNHHQQHRQQSSSLPATTVAIDSDQSALKYSNDGNNNRQNLGVVSSTNINGNYEPATKVSTYVPLNLNYEELNEDDPQTNNEADILEVDNHIDFKRLNKNGADSNNEIDNNQKELIGEKLLLRTMNYVEPDRHQRNHQPQQQHQHQHDRNEIAALAMSHRDALRNSFEMDNNPSSFRSTSAPEIVEPIIPPPITVTPMRTKATFTPATFSQLYVEKKRQQQLHQQQHPIFGPNISTTLGNNPFEQTPHPKSIKIKPTLKIFDHVKQEMIPIHNKSISSIFGTISPLSLLKNTQQSIPSSVSKYDLFKDTFQTDIGGRSPSPNTGLQSPIRIHKPLLNYRPTIQHPNNNAQPFILSALGQNNNNLNSNKVENNFLLNNNVDITGARSHHHQQQQQQQQQSSLTSLPVKISFVNNGRTNSNNDANHHVIDNHQKNSNNPRQFVDYLGSNYKVVKQVKGKNLLIDPSLEKDPARDNIIAQVLEMLNKYN